MRAPAHTHACWTDKQARAYKRAPAITHMLAGQMHKSIVCEHGLFGHVLCVQVAKQELRAPGSGSIDWFHVLCSGSIDLLHVLCSGSDGLLHVLCVQVAMQEPRAPGSGSEDEEGTGQLEEDGEGQEGAEGEERGGDGLWKRRGKKREGKADAGKQAKRAKQGKVCVFASLMGVLLCACVLSVCVECVKRLSASTLLWVECVRACRP